MIELRWVVSTEKKRWNLEVKVKRLQYRTLLGGYWSEWQDVPEVEAVKA